MFQVLTSEPFPTIPDASLEHFPSIKPKIGSFIVRVAGITFPNGQVGKLLQKRGIVWLRPPAAASQAPTIPPRC
jgi:hypothetical protein